ncbi:TIGR04222 domain-containing membrane protein [Chitinophaga pinensis]|uniref:TIGR04222 domain-containing membrane protein n=1 Tax=Chitinophaga pinensis (strain ATCC 43595 / DSM 2588 / LMG 13176 / NBRC 15968 / NCIMB 11800 / UQM 2034) TaxID=485918 RepID=A0A979G8K4_CHIPD|nr:TIGR04222 domain-containing membrane protein [Chitinophaga pinensis]ACU62740.1 conserved hypothetical protein [Chitinophaga pinensis DSM 2588]
MTQEQQTLWTKIQAFNFDGGSPVNHFTKKLAAEQNWTIAFTQKAIEEYKKFMLLCCTSPTGAAPSQIVDEVWHLHLTHTQSYWTDFCRNTLGQDVHHYPSMGGTQEDYKHLNWYKTTKRLYHRTFGTEAPEDIWPTPKEFVPVPEDPIIKWTPALKGWFTALCVLPFIFSGLIFKKLSPFDLKGPQFLVFFFVYASCLLTILAVYLESSKQQAVDVLKRYFPDDISPYQIAAFVYGRARAVQTGIVDLVKRGLIIPQGDHAFVLNKRGYMPRLNETNPLIPGFEAENDDADVIYTEISSRWYNPDEASHPLMVALDKFAVQHRPFINILYIALYGMAGARLIQGLINGKAVGYLIFEIVIVFVISKLTSAAARRDLAMYQAAKDCFIEKFGENPDKTDNIVPGFAVNGLSAVSGFAEIGFLTGMFATYTSSAFRNERGEPVNKDFGGASSCSSGGSGCSGSSCSSGGSGCGSSCGGGCGGCGGGGD